MRTGLQTVVLLAIGLGASTAGLALADSSTVARVSTPIQALAVDPNDPKTLYAGTNASDAPNDRGHGLFKSSNGGATWGASGLRAQSVFALAVDPRSTKTLYAGTYEGVVKSTDGGVSWRDVRLIADKNVASRSDAIAVNPRNPSVVYAATVAGIFRSANGGASWRNVLPDGYRLAVAIDPRQPQIVYADAYEHGLFKSTNDGRTWRHIAVGGQVDIDSLAVDPKNSKILYAGTNTANETDPNSGGVFKSTNGGLSWRKVGLVHVDVEKIVVDPQTPAIVYAGTPLGLAKTKDGGTTWAVAGFKGQGIGAIAIDPRRSRIVYVGTESAVFKSTNGGRTWSLSSRGIKNPG